MVGCCVFSFVLLVLYSCHGLFLLVGWLLSFDFLCSLLSSLTLSLFVSTLFLCHYSLPSSRRDIAVVVLVCCCVVVLLRSPVFYFCHGQGGIACLAGIPSPQKSLVCTRLAVPLIIVITYTRCTI